VISLVSVSSGTLASSDPNLSVPNEGSWAAPVIAQDIKIVNNTIIGFTPAEGVAGAPAIFVRGITNGYAEDIVISNNTIQDGYRSATTLGSRAIFVQNAYRATINENKIKNFAYGIDVSNGSGFSINNNVLSEFYNWPIVATTATGVAITANTLRRWRKPLERYAAAGLVHMLSISGLHIGLIAVALSLAAQVARRELACRRQPEAERLEEEQQLVHPLGGGDDPPHLPADPGHLALQAGAPAAQLRRCDGRGGGGGEASGDDNGNGDGNGNGDDNGEDNGGFLCRGLADTDDRRHLIVLRTPRTAVVLNRFPYATGHLMIAPFRHVGEVEELNDEEALDLHHLMQKSLKALKEAMTPDGFNIGMNLGQVAGAGIPDHVHWHVVPRWSGDTNFMPVIAETKVLPEMLTESFASLKAHYD
jgi:ATP adenylyltransferase